jgi:hypothetical protein
MKSHRAIVGDYNGVCDRCGFEFKASELLDTWDGLRVDIRCWEPRHILDYVKPPANRPEGAVPFVRKEGDPDFSRVPAAIAAVDDALPASTFPTTGTL